MAEVLQVQPREPHGKRHSRRLRAGGTVPAILYGHGQANVPLMVPGEALAAVVRQGRRVVELSGAANEKALIREVQWDTFGHGVLHVDFARVSEHERVQVVVAVELRGQAAGAKDGGVVEHFVHEVEIDCEALSIPDKLTLSVRDLAVGGHLTAADIPLPEGAKLLSEPDIIVAQCIVPSEKEEELPGAGEGAEPELIGRKAEEEGEEE